MQLQGRAASKPRQAHRPRPLDAGRVLEEPGPRQVQESRDHGEAEENFDWIRLSRLQAKHYKERQVRTCLK